MHLAPPANGCILPSVRNYWGVMMAFSRVEWVAVSAEQAQRHPLYGFGGWNWLLLALLLAQAASALLVVPGMWGIVAVVVLLVPAVPLVLNARVFRPIFFTYAALMALGAFASRIPAFVAVTKVPAGAGIPPSLLVLLAMAVYVNESRRINVTLCHRVRADDPVLHEAAA